MVNIDSCESRGMFFCSAHHMYTTVYPGLRGSNVAEQVRWVLDRQSGRFCGHGLNSIDGTCGAFQVVL